MRRRIEEDLRDALANDQLEMQYQPIVASKDNGRLAWKRCCAGTTRNVASSRRRYSCQWPRLGLIREIGLSFCSVLRGRLGLAGPIAGGGQCSARNSRATTFGPVAATLKARVSIRRGLSWRSPKASSSAIPTAPSEY